MARRIVVISSYNDEPTGELLKKSIAELSVRRLLAEWVVKGVSIRRRKIRNINLAALPREGMDPRPYIASHYEHHIEPKLVPLVWDKSPWERYLQVNA